MLSLHLATVFLAPGSVGSGLQPPRLAQFRPGGAAEPLGTWSLRCLARGRLPCREKREREDPEMGEKAEGIKKAGAQPTRRLTELSVPHRTRPGPHDRVQGLFFVRPDRKLSSPDSAAPTAQWARQPNEPNPGC